MTFAYYNEFDPAAAEWLRWLIAEGHIPNGWVDERSIVDVQPDDLAGYTQVHFFAGIGGWAYAARLAGWPDDRPIWTGSCPCQPFSVAGKGAGVNDVRHLWPDFFRLISACRPTVVMGEQVAGKAGYGWFDGVATDLENGGYACRAVDVPACAVDAPHIRSRQYWVAVADANGSGRDGRAETPERRAVRGDVAKRLDGAMADAQGTERGAGLRQDRPLGDGAFVADDAGNGELVNPASLGWGEGRAEPELRSGRSAIAGAVASSELGNAIGPRLEGQHGNDDGARGRQEPDRLGAASEDHNGTFWSDHEWLVCHGGKARRAKSGLPLLAHGIPGRVAAWRGFGNAIVPQLAAEVIKALMETEA